MSALKKAVSCVTPETTAVRRSSMGGFNTSLNDSLSGLVANLKFTPFLRNSSTAIPKLVLDEGSPSSFCTSASAEDVHISYEHDGYKTLDFNELINERLRPEDGTYFNSAVSERRASCGPSLQLWRSCSPDPGSQDIHNGSEDNSHSCSKSRSPKFLSTTLVHKRWSLDRSNEELLKVPCSRNRGISLGEIHNANVSPGYNTSHFQPSLFQSTPKFQDESPVTSNQCVSRVPSLSPCLEDNPKNNFPFDAKFNHNPSYKDTWIARSRESFNISVRTFRFPHAGVFCGNDSPYRQRRKSHGIPSSVPRKKDRRVHTHKIVSNKSCFDSSIFKKVVTPGTVIGKGGFGTVKIGLWKGKKVAVKIIQGKKLSSLKHEMNTIGLSSHPCLVKTYKIISNYQTEEIESSNFYTGKKETFRRMTLPSIFSVRATAGFYGGTPYFVSKMMNTAWIISELCSTVTLLNLIHSNATWTLRQKIRILEELASAVSYLHSFQLAHLDVKPSNCLFTMFGKLKLGDFGCCSKVGDALDQVLGTVIYQAPEILKGEKISEKCDIFSFAITAWHLLTLETPYSGLHPHVVIYKVTRLGYRPDTDFVEVKLRDRETLLERLLRRIIEQCWSPHTEARPSAVVLRRVLTALYVSPANG